MRHTPFRFLPAFDGLPLRYGHWPCKFGGNGGAVVFLGGRSEFMEKYLETLSAFNQRGFDVFSMDWRGQGLSGRMLRNPKKGYVKDYGDYVADLNQFLGEVVLPRQYSPLILAAHSMGGNVALQFLHRSGSRIDRAVLTAPLIRIHLADHTEQIGRLFSRWATRLGLGHAAIPSLRQRNTFEGPFDNNGLTSDRRRFNAIRRLIAANPHFMVTQVTFGWLDATFGAIDTIHQSGFAQKITAPVLLAVAEKDRVVSNDAIQKYALQLPRHRMITIPGACHEILQEKENMRMKFWHAFDAFVQ